MASKTVYKGLMYVQTYIVNPLAGDFLYLFAVQEIMKLKSFAVGSTFHSTPTQSAFTYSNPTMEIQDQGVIYVQSQQ